MSSGAGERTEKPTAKKLSDARKKGNIAKSRDLSAALCLLSAIILLKYGGGYMAKLTLSFTSEVFSNEIASIATPYRQEIIPYLLSWGFWFAIILLPFLMAITVFTYAANVVQTGFLFTVEPLKLNFSKLNPISGLKRLFNIQSFITLAMNVGKLCIILPIAWYTILSELESVIIILSMEPIGIFTYKADVVLSLALKLSILLLVLGLADYFWQRWHYLKKLNMTKQEVKDEFKQSEGDPQVKGKRRQLQRQMAMNRMMQEVPQAEVVVRNPTHFAVAISYKPDMPAPLVVAKGANKIAEKIIEEAKKSGVPLVENPPLARELYKRVEVGEEIPPELFATIAEILAYVLTGEKREKLLKSFSH